MHIFISFHQKNITLPQIIFHHELAFTMRFFFLLINLCCILITACSSCNSGNQGQQRQRRQRAQIAIVSPKNNDRQLLGKTITLSTKARDGAGAIDSVRWHINGKWLKTTKGEDVAWNTAGHTTGTQRIEQRRRRCMEYCGTYHRYATHRSSSVLCRRRSRHSCDGRTSAGSSSPRAIHL